MKWRKYKLDDYPAISQWFVGHGWPIAPDSTILPSTGIVVEDDQGPACVGFLYLTNSPLGYLEWLATRPELGREALPVLEYFMGIAKTVAKDLGIQKLFHFSKAKYVNTFEKKFGFKKTEELTVMMWE